MKPIIPPLEGGNQGDAVANLQDALAALLGRSLVCESAASRLPEWR